MIVSTVNLTESRIAGKRVWMEEFYLDKNGSVGMSLGDCLVH